MIKNILILVVLSWVTLSYAKVTVAHETVTEAENYKIEKPVNEEAPQRAVAGGKIKKKEAQGSKIESPKATESDSEVRYWQYSE